MPGYNHITPAIKSDRKPLPDFSFAVRDVILSMCCYCLFLLLPITMSTAQADLVKNVQGLLRILSESERLDGAMMESENKLSEAPNMAFL